MNKLTTYQQVKEFCKQKNPDYRIINIDNYTDEENKQITRWLIQAEQQSLDEKDILNLTEEQITLYGFNNDFIMLDVISEQSQKYLINDKEIIGKCIIEYPEFKIIKEDNKNNFYRIMKQEK